MHCKSRWFTCVRNTWRQDSSCLWRDAAPLRNTSCVKWYEIQNTNPLLHQTITEQKLSNEFMFKRKMKKVHKDEPTHINSFWFLAIFLWENVPLNILSTPSETCLLIFLIIFPSLLLYSLCWTVVAGGFKVVWDLFCENVCFDEQFQHVHWVCVKAGGFMLLWRDWLSVILAADLKKRSDCCQVDWLY